MTAMLMCVILITLVATNSATSATIKVTKPVGDNTEIVAGDSGTEVELKCEGAAGATFVFYNGSTQLESGSLPDGVSFATPTLKFNNFKTEYAGKYSCVATANAAATESKQLELKAGATKKSINDGAKPAEKVIKPILTVTSPKSGTAVAKDTEKVKLTCNTATKDVTYTFHKWWVDAPLEESSKDYVIGTFSETNVGIYICRAYSSHLTYSESGPLELEVGTAGGTTTAKGSAGQLKISFVMLALGTLLATLVL